MQEELNNIELEEMRQQLALLKGKLDNEALVNDRLIRNSMKDKIRFINYQAFVSILASILVIAMLPNLKSQFDLSWGFVGYSVLMMAVCVLFTWLYHRGVNPDLMNGNLVEAASRMRQLKQDYRNWKFIGYPMLAVWVAWFAVDLLAANSGADSETVYGIIAGLGVGLLLGGIVGLKMRHKVESSIDEIIDQASELENK